MTKVILLSFLIVIGLGIGAGIGTLTITQLPSHVLSRNHPLIRLMGVQTHEVIGFLPYWSINKISTDYEPYLTTLTYFGLVINPDGTIQKKVNTKELEPGWNTLQSKATVQKLREAKQDGYDLSLLVHLSDETAIQKLMADPEEHAQTLLYDVGPLMKQYGFTDLNLDIESFRDATPAAQQQFITFLKTVKSGLNQQSLGTLTVDISPSVFTRQLLINPKDAGAIADSIVLMAYDYHYTGSYISGPVAPFGGAGDTREFDVKMTIDTAQKTIPPSKLVLGIPLYGYEWETIPATAAAAVIPGSGRTMTYQRAADILSNCANCVTGIEPTSQESYVIFPDPKDRSYHTAFYNTADTITTKLHEIPTWKGAAVWALGYEKPELLSPFQAFKKQMLLRW